MKVILLKDVPKVGQRGTVATVADGYAQNVLLPKKFAIPATPENMKRIEAEHALAKDKKALVLALQGKAFDAIDGKTVMLKVRANEQGGLFEAVQKKHIRDAIEHTLGVSVREEDIELPEPVKKVGKTTLRVGTAHIALTTEKSPKQ